MSRRRRGKQNDWNPTADIVGRFCQLFYDVAAEGDSYISVNSPFRDDATVLVRVSSEALKRTCRFFGAQFSDRWTQGRDFTASKPLLLDERFVEFVTFLHFCHEDDVVSQSASVHLRNVAILCDKYLFEGRLPAWCLQSLNARLPADLVMWQLAITLGHRTVDVLWRINMLFEILQTSYLFNFPEIFAKASRAVMWLVPQEKVETQLPTGLVELVGFDFAENFKEEAVRLRKDLVSKLPAVFYPDQHGESLLGCGKCASVPQDERWRREIICKNSGWQEEHRRGKPFLAMKRLFHSYIEDMDSLARRQQCNSRNERKLDCGRFGLRHLDVTPQEAIWQVFQAIGGLCLPCVKSGEFKFKMSCDLHDVDLCLN
jgi:hypothetical protein